MNKSKIFKGIQNKIYAIGFNNDIAVCETNDFKKICDFYKITDWDINLDDNLNLVSKKNNITLPLIFKDNMTENDYENNFNLLNKNILCKIKKV